MLASAGNDTQCRAARPTSATGQTPCRAKLRHSEDEIGVGQSIPAPARIRTRCHATIAAAGIRACKFVPRASSSFCGCGDGALQQRMPALGDNYPIEHYAGALMRGASKFS